MIMQAYQIFDSFNNTGVTGLFLYPAHVVPNFIPFVLFTLFVITLFASMMSQKRLTGRGDFLPSFAVASYFIMAVAVVMSLVEGLINITTVIITIVLSVISTILLLIDRESSIID